MVRFASSSVLPSQTGRVRRNDSFRSQDWPARHDRSSPTCPGDRDKPSRRVRKIRANGAIGLPRERAIEDARRDPSMKTSERLHREQRVSLRCWPCSAPWGHCTCRSCGRERADHRDHSARRVTTVGVEWRVSCHMKPMPVAVASRTNKNRTSDASERRRYRGRRQRTPWNQNTALVGHASYPPLAMAKLEELFGKFRADS